MEMKFRAWDEINKRMCYSHIERKASIELYLILALLAVGLLIAAISCKEIESQPGNQGRLMRAKVLENNTITWCRLNPVQNQVIRSGDSVWLSLDTHTICDTSNYTMKAVVSEVKETKTF